MNARSLVFWSSTLFLSVGCFAQDPGEYRSLIENDPLLRSIYAPRVVSIETLNETPATYRDVPVRLVIAFESRGRIQNPFFTRFTNEAYLNFAAWDGERPLWDAKEFVSPHSLFFADRDSGASKVFTTAKRFERFEVRAVVKDTFAGRAWIQVLEAKPLEKSLSKAVIRHVHNGLAQMNEGRPSVAAGELRRALEADLPESHRAQILLFTARAYERMNRHDLASPFLAEAHQLRPQDREIRYAYQENLAWNLRRGMQGDKGAVAKQSIPANEQDPAATTAAKPGENAQPQAAQQGEEAQESVIREAKPIEIESKKELDQTPEKGKTEGSTPPAVKDPQTPAKGGGARS